jgi:hypothetical protein
MTVWLSLIGVLVAPLLAGAGSLLFRSNRLRKSIKAELDIAAQLADTSSTGKAISTSLGRKIAELAAIGMVPQPWLFEVWLVISAALGIGCIAYVHSDPTNPLFWLGLVLYAASLVFLFLLLTKVAYLRSRQVRAIIANRASGLRMLNSYAFTTRHLLDQKVVLPQYRSRRAGGGR